MQVFCWRVRASFAEPHGFRRQAFGFPVDFLKLGFVELAFVEED